MVEPQMRDDDRTAAQEMDHEQEEPRQHGTVRRHGSGRSGEVEHGYLLTSFSNTRITGYGEAASERKSSFD